MANAMFREAMESVGASEALPSSPSTSTTLGGFGAALPSHQVPDSAMGSAAAAEAPNGPGPANATPLGTAKRLGGVGIAFPSTPLPDTAVPGIA
jgi:hypothetical protein